MRCTSLLSHFPSSSTCLCSTRFSLYEILVFVMDHWGTFCLLFLVYVHLCNLSLFSNGDCISVFCLLSLSINSFCWRFLLIPSLTPYTNILLRCSQSTPLFKGLICFLWYASHCQHVARALQSLITSSLVIVISKLKLTSFMPQKLQGIIIIYKSSYVLAIYHKNLHYLMFLYFLITEVIVLYCIFFIILF